MKGKEKRKYDVLWSEKIKRLAGYKCELCGKESTLNSHHIFSRRHLSIRWSPLNGISLCVGHHFFAHQNSLEFAVSIIKVRGEDWYNTLLLKKNSVKDYQADILALLSEEQCLSGSK